MKSEPKGARGCTLTDLRALKYIGRTETRGSILWQTSASEEGLYHLQCKLAKGSTLFNYVELG